MSPTANAHADALHPKFELWVRKAVGRRSGIRRQIYIQSSVPPAWRARVEQEVAQRVRAAEAQPPGAPPATDAAAAAAAEEPKEDGKDKPRKRVDWPRVGLAFVLVVVCVGGYLVALGLFLPDGFGGRDVDVRWDLVRRPDGPMPPLKYTPPRPTGVDDKWDILRLVGLLLGGICAVGSVGLLFSALVPREPEKKKEEKKEEKKSKKKKKR